MLSLTLFQPSSQASHKKLSKAERSQRTQILRQLLHQEDAENLFQLTVAVAGRCLRLTGEMGKVRRILAGFLDVVGEGLGEALINYTEELIPSLNSSKILDPNFFEIVAKINVLIQRIDLTWMEVMKEGGGKDDEEGKKEEGLQKKEKVIQKMENMLHKIIKNGLASLFIPYLLLFHLI